MAWMHGGFLVTSDAEKKKGTRTKVLQRRRYEFRWLMVCGPSCARLQMSLRNAIVRSYVT